MQKILAVAPNRNPFKGLLLEPLQELPNGLLEESLKDPLEIKKYQPDTYTYSRSSKACLRPASSLAAVKVSSASSAHCSISARLVGPGTERENEIPVSCDYKNEAKRQSPQS